MAARLSALRAGRILPQGFFIFKDSWYVFMLEAIVRPEGLGQFKKVHLIGTLNPRPSGLQHSALTTTLARAPLPCGCTQNY
jgi:hypothetical protein